MAASFTVTSWLKWSSLQSGFYESRYRVRTGLCLYSALTGSDLSSTVQNISGIPCEPLENCWQVITPEPIIAQMWEALVAQSS